MIAPDHDLDALFKRLHLANARRVWRDLVQRAERESWSYRDFLGILAAEEIAHRQQTRLARLSRWAHFPFLKTIDAFNFAYQTSLRLTMLGSALAPDFVTEGRSLIFTGKPGRGKTHCENQSWQADPGGRGVTPKLIGGGRARLPLPWICPPRLGQPGHHRLA
jgi:DNA replication protein DnaC